MSLILATTSLYQMSLTQKYDINILSIKRSERMVEVTKDTMIRIGDRITLFGPCNNIKYLFKNDEKKGLFNPFLLSEPVLQRLSELKPPDSLGWR